MATAGYRGGAGASARRMADVARAAERAAQHRRAKVVLPLLTAAAAVAGWAVAAVGSWQLGLVAGLVVAGLGVWRLYRRARNSWAVGAAGEARTARLLAPLVRRGHAVILHDRAVPGSRANLDHLVFTAAGAFYIDTKNWTSKRSRLTVRGGTLWYGRYAQSRALQTVVWEAGQAARALGVPVRPVVAVHGAKVPAPHGRLELQGVTVVEAKRLRGLLQSLPPRPGWDTARMAAVRQLAERTLPPAS
ncbi:NERD domain-containing protein [Streptomyces thermoviolaceus subsp. thermoviolaceus]|uniref:NERD domain-containing protein n=2 Tax=Streptomyces thermoviolaceus TaxID=1952 RepID=A0ABX0YVU6_STRTL|nr:NERD domain-containing protein [Streptomyces thermoviolaceus subsp. thermoviolaceus]